MPQIVVMVEERSMGIVAQAILEKLSLANHSKVIPHEGKGDLEVSFPRKLKGWSAALAPRFVICCDNDGGNCLALKQRLIAAVPLANAHPFKFRIVMQELESWYLGDMLALERAGLIKAGQAARLTQSRKYRSPESISDAKLELQKLVKKTGQLDLARQIAPHLDLDQNSAQSFHQFVAALRWASIAQVM